MKLLRTGLAWSAAIALLMGPTDGRCEEPTTEDSKVEATVETKPEPPVYAVFGRLAAKDVKRSPSVEVDGSFSREQGKCTKYDPDRSNHYILRLTSKLMIAESKVRSSESVRSHIRYFEFSFDSDTGKAPKVPPQIPIEKPNWGSLSERFPEADFLLCFPMKPNISGGIDVAISTEDDDDIWVDSEAIAGHYLAKGTSVFKSDKHRVYLVFKPIDSQIGFSVEETPWENLGARLRVSAELTTPPQDDPRPVLIYKTSWNKNGPPRRGRQLVSIGTELVFKHWTEPDPWDDQRKSIRRKIPVVARKSSQAKSAQQWIYVEDVAQFIIKIHHELNLGKDRSEGERAFSTWIYKTSPDPAITEYSLDSPTRHIWPAIEIASSIPSELEHVGRWQVCAIPNGLEDQVKKWVPLGTVMVPPDKKGLFVPRRSSVSDAFDFSSYDSIGLRIGPEFEYSRFHASVVGAKARISFRGHAREIPVDVADAFSLVPINEVKVTSPAVGRMGGKPGQLLLAFFQKDFEDPISWPKAQITIGAQGYHDQRFHPHRTRNIGLKPRKTSRKINIWFDDAKSGARLSAKGIRVEFTEPSGWWNPFPDRSSSLDVRHGGELTMAGGVPMKFELIGAAKDMYRIIGVHGAGKRKGAYPHAWPFDDGPNKRRPIEIILAGTPIEARIKYEFESPQETDDPPKLEFARPGRSRTNNGVRNDGDYSGSTAEGGNVTIPNLVSTVTSINVSMKGTPELEQILKQPLALVATNDKVLSTVDGAPFVILQRSPGVVVVAEASKYMGPAWGSVRSTLASLASQGDSLSRKLRFLIGRGEQNGLYFSTLEDAAEIQKVNFEARQNSRPAVHLAKAATTANRLNLKTSRVRNRIVYIIPNDSLLAIPWSSEAPPYDATSVDLYVVEIGFSDGGSQKLEPYAKEFFDPENKRASRYAFVTDPEELRKTIEEFISTPESTETVQP